MHVRTDKSTEICPYWFSMSPYTVHLKESQTEELNNEEDSEMWRRDMKIKRLENMCYFSFENCGDVLLSTSLIDTMIIYTSIYIRFLVFLSDYCTIYLTDDRATSTLCVLQITILSVMTFPIDCGHNFFHTVKIAFRIITVGNRASPARYKKETGSK